MKYFINKKINIYILVLSIFIIPSISKAAFVGASSPVTATTSCNTGLSCGLVGYWTFDGKDIINGVVKDVSGSGNNGNPSGIASSTFYTPGKIGQGARFDGATNYVKVTSSAGTIKAEGTYSMWIKPNTVSGQYTFFSIGQGTGGAGNYTILQQLNSSVLARVYTSIYQNTTASSVLSVKKWTHVVFINSVSQSRNEVYINGVLISTGDTYQDSSANHTYLEIGRDTTASSYFSGSVDDVRIYNRALSAQEVQQLYSMGTNTKIGAAAVASSTNACTTGISCGLVGYWTFDGKDVVNGVILDKSGMGNNGNPVSIASSTFYAPGKIGQGANFNGYVLVPDNSSLKPSGPMSWGGWINQYTTKSNQTALSKVTIGTSGYMLYTSTTFPAQCFAYGLTPANLSDPTTFTKNTWVHYMCVYDGSQLKIYKNGVLVNFTSVTGSITHTTNGLSLGSYAVTSTRFEGKADDLRVYNRALSDKEVQQLYSMGANTKIGATAVASSTSACSSGLSCGLVGYWTFDGKDISNGVLLDKSGNNNKGNLISIASTTFYAPGKLGQAGNFDGVNDKVLLGDNLDLIGSPLTISAWVNPTSYSGLSSNSPSIVDKLLTGGNYRLNLLNGLAQFFIRDSGGSAETLNSTANSVPLNKWTHVLAVYDNSTTGRIYINGVLNATRSNFTLTRGNTSSQLQIGNNDNNANSIFSGKIDDVRIYNRVLSAQEVLQLYNLGR